MATTQERNLLRSREICDQWYDEEPRPAGREDYWVRLVAALLTETGCYNLAHDGVWNGGGHINARQSELLRQSLDMRDADGNLLRDTEGGPDGNGIGHNGGSVGPLQQIPTEVAQAADKPWDGWGSIRQCMTWETSLPAFLDVLSVSGDTSYKGKPMASAIVADLLRVQQPLASEVDANYGGSITANAQAKAAQYPCIKKDWFTTMTASNWDEAKAELVQALAGIEDRVADKVTGKILAILGDRVVKSKVTGGDYTVVQILEEIEFALGGILK